MSDNEPGRPAPPQGDMRPMWTFEGEKLRDLFADLATPEGNAEDGLPPIHTVRFAVDEGTLKWKINEDMWSVGWPADGRPS